MKITEVPLLVESARGCGYRKPGGLYLRSDCLPEACCRLPHILHICPTCGEGFRPSRAPRVVNPREIFESPEDERGDWSHCGGCILSPKNIGRMGDALLIWVGTKFYPTARDFVREANEKGVSRRITAVPRGFELGRTYVMLAHNKTFIHMPDISNGKIESLKPPTDKAIFSVFRPDRIEYVCKGTESPEELDKLVGRGLTPVRVVKDIEEI